MRVLGVLDLLNGCAVHARAGDREQYEPVCVVAGASIEAGDARGMAGVYRDRLGLTEWYAADRGWIMGHSPHDRIVSSLAATGPLWLDAGVSSLDGARHA